ncbi:MAG: ATP-binding protein [Polyangiaceae bacterium]
MEQPAAVTIAAPANDEGLFRLALEATPTGIVMVDAAGHIVLVNAEIERLFEYERKDLLGSAAGRLLAERYRDSAGPLRSPTLAPQELWGRRQGGSEFPIEISSKALSTAGGRFVLSVLSDISERRRIEQSQRQQGAELERSNRELEQFAYVASHDLREPLRMVATYVTLLERDYGEKLGNEAREYVRFASDGAKRLTRLVSDLLEYARISPKSLAFEPVDCNSTVAQAVAGLTASIEQSGTRLEIQNLPTVLGDAVLLGQVFQNLIENGIKFRANEPPWLRISAERVDAEWHFHVSDNGLGIEPRFHVRIFELFQRLHTKDSYPGTGMGLALCKKVVERHGGRVWVDSRLGQGSVFSFSLPVAPPHDKP